MRAVIQRVKQARVEVGEQIVGQIARGLLVYVGVSTTDGPDQAEWLAGKVASLRIFEDDRSKLNLSVQDVRGGVLAVPNFTLMADAQKGRRPEFTQAACGDDARELFETFAAELSRAGCNVATGRFGATMIIHSVAAGPVNILLDTDAR